MNKEFRSKLVSAVIGMANPDRRNIECLKEDLMYYPDDDLERLYVNWDFQRQQRMSKRDRAAYNDKLFGAEHETK